jgi:ElaB/YqjD/DUF883 family membrane-anchored ribosome-binding protein
MDQSTDQIRQEIDANRQGAAEKIDQLQTQVQDSAQQVRENVQGSVEDTVQTVKGAVDDTVLSVKEGVENFDLRQQIEARPLVSLGAAFIGGFVLGGILGGDDHRQGGQQYNGSPQYSGGQHQQHADGRDGGSGSLATSVRSAIQKTGLDDTLSNATAALIASVTDQVKETIDRNFPGFTDKMQTAQQAPGGIAEKSREAQSV